jgi:DNA-binding response OmpR family regulator
MVSTIVIADDASVVPWLTGILAANGHQVTTAADGATGLRMLTETMFDLVITDTMLPGLSGLDVVSRGRVRSPGTRFLAIIGGDPESVASPTMQKFRADGMLLRPFKEADLLAVVAELLAESRAFG